MGKGLNKAARLKEIERLLVQHRGGYTASELANRFEIDRSTAWRDLQELETTVPLVEVGKGRFALDRMNYPSLIRLSMTEALMVYLALRHLARHTRFAETMVADALEKTAMALHQPMTERIVKAAAHITIQEEGEAKRGQIIETIVRGWIEHYKIRIRHRKLRGKETRSYVVSPYLIEPSIWGAGAYLVGYSAYHEGIATFKVERIEGAILTNEQFDPPGDLDADELLQHAWGIWYGEGEPVLVRLRFSDWVMQRVQETVWHPEQKITLLSDGGCEWRAEVAEWREMVPWIRGWGADCEVLAPTELRDVVSGNVRRMAEMYGWVTHREEQEVAHSSKNDPFGLGQTFSDYFGE